MPKTRSVRPKKKRIHGNRYTRNRDLESSSSSASATESSFLLERGQMNLLEWCMRENLISSRYEYPKCGKDMVLRERKGTIDGYEWRCRTKGGENPHDVCKSLRKGLHGVAVLKESEPLGGEEKIVEIDESMFGKMKYGKGKPVNGQWVFGGVERNSNKCFFRVVPNTTKEELLSVIKEWVVPGSVIISDCW
ncbi:mitotic-spindle organizing protein 2A [Trichonephila clavipes]|nr:mitotic-spindle organizing protein 2A [Trichonephila clavipes]